MKTFEIENKELGIIEQFHLLNESQCQSFKLMIEILTDMEQFADEIKSRILLFCES